MSELLLKNYVATGAITRYRIVKFGGADGAVVQAAGAADLSIGVCAELSVVSGERVDVHRSGMPLVEYGGTVTRGARLTADATGRAVAAAPAAGANVQIIGIAEASAVEGDIAPMLLAPSVMQGA